MDSKPAEASIAKLAPHVSTITSQRIFFGHASVGYNIIAGMEEIALVYPELSIMELDEGQAHLVAEAGLYHGRNGKNFLPKSKCDAFKAFMTTTGKTCGFDIAFFKFCYVDIKKDTDVQALFNYYVDTINSVKTNCPGITVIHVTVPLTVHQWDLKGVLRNLLRNDIDNIKRHQYNELVREAYDTDEVIFDLARIESTRPDGRRMTFTDKGQSYFSLYRQYSSDGGHLNDQGQLMAASELVRVLARATELNNKL